MGRVKYATKNIAFGWMGNVATLLLGAALRQVFIRSEERRVGKECT